MKSFKKSWLALLICTIAMLFGVAFTACSKNAVDANDERVAITVVGATENESLLEYMQTLQNEGKLSFTIDNGMVTSINGISQTTNTFWMLYTSDSDNANAAWGTCEYENQTLGSATLGAESLKVKEGFIYVWVFTKF